MGVLTSVAAATDGDGLGPDPAAASAPAAAPAANGGADAMGATPSIAAPAERLEAIASVRRAASSALDDAPGADAPDPDRSEGLAPSTGLLGGFWESLSQAADFFFRRPEGEEQHGRSWGFVPLVIADSNRGFGAGLAIVDRDLFGSGARGEINATFSSSGFFEPEVSLRGRPISFGRSVDLSWALSGEYRNRPRLYFNGIGNRTKRRDRASLALEETRAEVRLGAAFTEHVNLFAIFRFQNVNARDGDHGPSIRSVSEQFDTSQLVGFGSAGYTNALGGMLAIDYRDNDFDPTQGIYLELEALYHGKEIGSAPFRFGTYRGSLSVYLPLPASFVLALRGQFELVDASARRVPFYALPALGGASTLRGYLEGRVRDRHALLLQAELRFPLWKVLKGAAFFDIGRVYDDIRAPLDPPFISHFRWSVGGGVRFVLHPDILVRLDAAYSTEEPFLFWLSFGHAF